MISRNVVSDGVVEIIFALIANGFDAADRSAELAVKAVAAGDVSDAPIVCFVSIAAREATPSVFFDASVTFMIDFSILLAGVDIFTSWCELKRSIAIYTVYISWEIHSSFTEKKSHILFDTRPRA